MTEQRSSGRTPRQLLMRATTLRRRCDSYRREEERIRQLRLQAEIELCDVDRELSLAS